MKRPTEQLCFAAFKATFTSMSVVICAILCSNNCDPGFTKLIACADTIYRCWLPGKISAKSALAVSALTLMLFHISFFQYGQEADYSQIPALVRVAVNAIHMFVATWRNKKEKK